MKMGKPATCTDPDVPIRLCKKTIQVGVFPNQALSTPIVMPFLPVEDIYAAIGAHVNCACGTATDKVTLAGVEAIFSGIVGDSRNLILVVKGQPAYPKRFFVANPDGSIGGFGNGNQLVLSQALIDSVSLPLAIPQTCQSMAAGDPEPSPPVDDRPEKILCWSVRIGRRDSNLFEMKCSTFLGNRTAAEEPSLDRGCPNPIFLIDDDS